MWAIHTRGPAVSTVLPFKIIAIALVVAAVAFAGCGDDLGNSPDTRGMALPQAKVALKRAGYSVTTTDDGVFGIMVPEHFIVCKQKEINANMVRLDVAKHGC